MSWLKSLVRPKIATKTKREVREGIWVKCPGCGEMLYTRDLAANLHVCASCQHHLRMPLDMRLNYLVDADTFSPIDVPKTPTDPLKFKDRKKYTDRLAAAKKDTGADDAYQVGTVAIGGQKLVLCALDFDFMAGSMGTAVGQAIAAAGEEAVRQKLPLLIIPASGGARMQEGILSLMQMARTSAAVLRVKDAGLPYITLLTDPTTGGVTASFAMQGDITLAEPGALIGFAGPRVIQQTIGETLPQGFQTAEYLVEKGMVDAIVPRATQKAYIAQLIKHLTRA